MRLCIGIPTINRADLLRESLVSLAETCPEAHVVLVDNGHQGIDWLLDEVGRRYGRYTLIENDRNLGVAGSWNQLARIAWEHDHTHVWIVNDDIVLGRDEREVVRAILRHPERVLLAPEARYASFVLPRAVHEAVGDFDESFFPAYCEDDDYDERLERAGLPTVTEHLLEPKKFRRMSSSARDSKLYDYERAKARLIAKWGPEIELRLLAR